MAVKTFELRSDGESEEILTIPEVDLLTAPQLIQKFAELQPVWGKMTKVFNDFRGRVKTTIASDFPDGYQLQNGKVLSIERSETVVDMRSLIEYLEEKGREDLVERTVDLKKLREACIDDPEFTADVAPFVEKVGQGSLTLRGKAMVGHDFANTDIEIGQLTEGISR
jgi:hypothetical protein